jgi:hypothetical protein
MYKKVAKLVNNCVIAEISKVMASKSFKNLTEDLPENVYHLIVYEALHQYDQVETH